MTSLPPGETKIVCDMDVRKPGKFASQLHLFVADPGTREIVFKVHGQAKKAGAAKNPKSE